MSDYIETDPARAAEVAIGLGHTPLGCGLCQKRGILCPTHAAEVAVAAARPLIEAEVRARLVEEITADAARRYKEASVPYSKPYDSYHEGVDDGMDIAARIVEATP